MILKTISLLVLFYLLTPGILWSYRKKTNKYLIGFMHAFLFTIIWNVIQNFKEGLDAGPSPSAGTGPSTGPGTGPSKSKDIDEEDDDKPPIALKFVLDTDLYDDPEVIAKINKMEGPPIIVGASQFKGPTKNKSSLLFTNYKNKTSKLDDLIKIDIVDPIQKKIKDFIEFHTKYPEME